MGKEKILKALLRYVLENPNVGDNFEGITGWWIKMETGVATDPEEVKEVVDLLVFKGMLIEKSVTNTSKIYRVNKLKLDEIRTFVDRME